MADMIFTDKYSFKFKLRDTVRLLSLLDWKNIIGKVISIWITYEGIKYEVRYFLDGKPQEAYFFDDEIEKVEGGK